jgi:hypothetical protein
MDTLAAHSFGCKINFLYLALYSKRKIVLSNKSQTQSSEYVGIQKKREEWTILNFAKQSLKTDFITINPFMYSPTSSEVNQQFSTKILNSKNLVIISINRHVALVCVW